MGKTMLHHHGGRAVEQHGAQCVVGFCRDCCNNHSCTCTLRQIQHAPDPVSWKISVIVTPPERGNFVSRRPQIELYPQWIESAQLNTLLLKTGCESTP